MIYTPTVVEAAEHRSATGVQVSEAADHRRSTGEPMRKTNWPKREFGGKPGSGSSPTTADHVAALEGGANSLDLDFVSQLRTERSRLVQQSYARQLTSKESARRKVLEWMLDRAELSLLATDLGRLEKLAKSYESLAHQVGSLVSALSAKNAVRNFHRK